MSGEGLPEPLLSDADRALFEKGVAEFNDGLYFECHESLEDLWTGVRGPTRDFFQGLIQVSVAFYHLGNANLAGAESMARRALKRFERYPERYFGFDLAAQREALVLLLERIARGDAEVAAPDPPRWTFERADREDR